MNAPGAHYVANADAKVQLFLGITITLQLFLHHLPTGLLHGHLIFNQLDTKSLQTTIFSLFLCNFAVAVRLLPRQHTQQRFKNKEIKDICRIFVTSLS